jgi:hypothetical protein
MREFLVAAEAEQDEGEIGPEITVGIQEKDGTMKQVTFLPITEGQLALVLASDVQGMAQKISTAINLFFNLLKDMRDIDHYRARMYDRTDKFGSANIAEVIEGLVEEWTANPTSSPSDSTSSQGSTGSSSTAKPRRAGRTHSAFGQTDSAT